MRYAIFLFILFCFGCRNQKNLSVSLQDNRLEYETFFEDFEKNFIYLDDKKELIECIKKTYRPYVDTLTSAYHKVLFYENLLIELYDSHISLNTNTGESYRLRSPIYIKLKNNKAVVEQVFLSQLNYTFSENILGAEILQFNEIEFDQMIDSFPSKCQNKQDPEVREWLANKIIAGKRHLPRLLKLKLLNGQITSLDMDLLVLKNDTTLIQSSIIDNIGIIRINNSLGNSELVKMFDESLDDMMETDGLILDLRNTPNGGNTSVAEPILGRFISRKQGYQICKNASKQYTKQVDSRKEIYVKPVYVLAGRWTGSMGEGMTIGFDGMNRATIIGTELNRLAGGMKTIGMLKSNFGFSVSFEKMLHLNGTLREDFVPKDYIVQKNIDEDEFLAYALRLAKDN